MPTLFQLIVLGALCGFATGCKARQDAEIDAATPVVVDAANPLCAELTARLCAHFGKSSETCDFVKWQTQRFRPQFCHNKLGKFELTVAELSNYQDARALIALPAQKSRTVEAPVIGPRDAPVILTVFCDFAAPDCSRLSPLPGFVKKLYGDRVRLVYHQVPLMTNPDAQRAAEASLAANAQGKFWEYHDVLFSNQHDQSRVALERYATVVGLNLPEFKKALDDHSYAADVDADKALGKSLFISVLPAVFANGRPIAAPYGVVELAQIVDEAMAKRGVEP